MALHRTIFALLLSLTMAFAPVASLAMAKSCSMTSGMTNATTETSNCPCHEAMPQCQTAGGCASQCFTFFSATLPALSALRAPAHVVAKVRDGLTLASLSMRPPSPPPRT